MRVVQLNDALRTIYKTFLQGLIVVFPVVITFAILVWLATIIENMLSRVMSLFVSSDTYSSGLGLVIAIALIFAVGVMMKTWATRRILARGEELLERIPIVKSIYGSIRDISSAFEKKGSRRKFHKVVTVSIGGDARLIGMVTRENVTELPRDDSSNEIVGVYLPMSYQIGGYTIFVPRSAIEPIDMEVEDAMRFVLTAGISKSNGNGARHRKE